MAGKGRWNFVRKMGRKARARRRAVKKSLKDVIVVEWVCVAEETFLSRLPPSQTGRPVRKGWVRGPVKEKGYQNA